MSQVKIECEDANLIATIQLPASKSISNRALVLNEVLKQKKLPARTLENLSTADDTQIIKKALSEPNGVIDIKNAGTCLRFLTAYFAAVPGLETTLTGNERMKQRPISALVQALKFLGADIRYLENEGVLPITIKGTKLKGGKVSLDPSHSSQFASALMLAAPLMENPLEISLEGNLVSKNYIEMTQSLLQEFGFESSFSENTILVQTEYKPKNIENLAYTIEADWSSAAFFYEAALVAVKADILFPGLHLKSIQGDAIIAQWMEELGIKSLQKEEGVYITKGKSPSNSKFEFDFTHHPDLAPAMICATAGASYQFMARGLASLAHKESNRIEALSKGLLQLNYKVKSNDNSLEHDGIPHAFYTNQIIDTLDDHRICMAFACLSIFQSEIFIGEVESVIKSFPNFWKEAAKIGMKIRIESGGKKN
jgi:3-phosphoshikimate 1-carboxyvinyltransferase